MKHGHAEERRWRAAVEAERNPHAAEVAKHIKQAFKGKGHHPATISRHLSALDAHFNITRVPEGSPQATLYLELMVPFFAKILKTQGFYTRDGPSVGIPNLNPLRHPSNAALLGSLERYYQLDHPLPGTVPPEVPHFSMFDSLSTRPELKDIPPELQDRALKYLQDQECLTSMVVGHHRNCIAAFGPHVTHQLYSAALSPLQRAA